MTFKEKYATDPDFKKKVLARNREWRHSNRARLAATQRMKKSKDPKSFLLYAARTRAKKEGVPFNLTVEDIEIPNFCPVLGFPLFYGRGHAGPCSPSLDKIHPRLGYVKGNVCVISFKANTIKQNATALEVEMVARWMRAREK